MHIYFLNTIYQTFLIFISIESLIACNDVCSEKEKECTEVKGKNSHDKYSKGTV